MQPINSRTLLEEVNDSDIPMEPLHYPVRPLPDGEVPAATASSADESVLRRQGRQIKLKHLNTT